MEKVSESRDKKTILIVEDDVEIGELLTEVLREEGIYLPIVALTGVAALALLLTLRPHLFILDYQLPGAMNGLEVYDWLRGRADFLQTPVLFMSANLPSSLAKSRQLTVLSKPFDLSDFLWQVKKLVPCAPP